MADTLCAFPDRDDALVTYLYDDMDAAERATFDAHLAICARCRHEVEEFRGVREDLARWVPPSLDAAGPRPSADVQRAMPIVAAPRSWWRDIPAWAQVAAALLFLGVSAAIAHLDVRYDAQGLSVRTGWSSRGISSPASSQEKTSATAAAGRTGDAPWRTELTSLEQQLRAEMRATISQNAPAVQTPAAGAISEAELMRRVRTMIETSEKRQQNELALRTVELMNSVRAQRNADLIKIDTALGALQDKTDSRLLKQNATLNYLVSAKQKQ